MQKEKTSWLSSIWNKIDLSDEFIGLCQVAGVILFIGVLVVGLITLITHYQETPSSTISSAIKAFSVDTGCPEEKIKGSLKETDNDKNDRTLYVFKISGCGFKDEYVCRLSQASCNIEGCSKTKLIKDKKL